MTDGIRPPGEGKRQDRRLHHPFDQRGAGNRRPHLKRPAMIAYDVSFDGGTGQEEHELIRSRIGDVLAA